MDANILRNSIALVLVAVGVRPVPLAKDAGKSSTDIRNRTAQHAMETYGRLPLSFEANLGQTAGPVTFLSRGQGYTLFLTRRAEAVLVLSNSAPKRASLQPTDAQPIGVKLPPRALSQSALRLKLLGVKRAPQFEGLEEFPGKVNYFIGNKPEKWHANVPIYAKVKIRAVYPGVDLTYYGSQGQLEHDFLVAPGADPATIRMAAKGAQGLWLDDNGDLVATMQSGEVRLHKPVAYQEVDGVRREIASRYVLKGKDQIGFDLAPYDETRSLIIDPTLSYSTYLGGAGSDGATAVAVDAAGNAYVTGQTDSTNFPTNGTAPQNSPGGGIDAFVTKLNPSGTGSVYSTYLGGNGDDIGLGIALDSAGNAYVTGRTQSTNFPTTTGAYQIALAGTKNAFVTKIDSNGSALVYSTYLGGSADQDEFNTPLQSAFAIGVDSSGNAYVTGYTDATDFPTTPGAFQTSYNNAFFGSADAFVTKLNPSGSGLVYSTYLGIATGFAISVDSSGDAYVAGLGQNVPTTPGAFQTSYIAAYSNSFVSKLNPSGTALIYSTYLGGNGWATGIAVDSNGSAYVTGLILNTLPTSAGAFQTSNAGNISSFVTKFNSTGSALVYSTYLNGTSDTQGSAIALDSAGNAYVTGFTNSTDYPTTSNANQPTFGGGYDAFVTVLNSGGTAPIYSSFLGGSGSDSGGGIALDAFSNVYVTGATNSTNFPTTAGAFQTTAQGSNDAFVTKIAGIACAGENDDDDDHDDHGRHRDRDDHRRHDHRHKTDSHPCKGSGDPDSDKRDRNKE